MESTRLKIIVQEQCAIIDALLGFVPKTIFQRSYQIPRFIFMSSAINVKIQFSGTLVKKLQTKTNFSTKSIELNINSKLNQLKLSLTQFQLKCPKAGLLCSSTFFLGAETFLFLPFVSWGAGLLPHLFRDLYNFSIDLRFWLEHKVFIKWLQPDKELRRRRPTQQPQRQSRSSLSLRFANLRLSQTLCRRHWSVSKSPKLLLLTVVIPSGDLCLKTARLSNLG